MATVSNGSKKERFGFIKAYGAELGVRYLCDWLGVSPSGFYKWLKRPESQRAKRNRDLSGRIEQLFWLHKGNYGSPRIHKALRDEGVVVNYKRVVRLMREAGLVGKAGRLYRRKPAADKFYTKMPNLRLNAGKPTGIDQQWVGDLTYLKVNGEWRYLAVVMDLYSRRIIGWSLGAYKTAELTREAIRRALSHRRVKPGLIFHTDRGSEYGAYLMQDELNRVHIKSSMNRPNHVTDNTHIESFFRSMKTECIKGFAFKDESELRATLCWYLDDYYNHRRHHSGIGYTTPINYERMAA